MATFIGLSCVVLGLLAVRGRRWAYILLVVLGIAYFPLETGFQLHPRGCQFFFDGRLALFSFTNYAHITLFAIFFLTSYAHFSARQRSHRAALFRATTATLLMGALVEIVQGVSGSHNCRARDLIPDATGMALGFVLVVGRRYLARAVASRKQRERTTDHAISNT